MTDIFEGSIIRLARRLDEFLNQVNLTDLLALILYYLWKDIGELYIEGKHYPVILLSPLTNLDLFFKNGFIFCLLI